MKLIWMMPLVMLMACTQAQEAIDQTARKSAKAAVSEALVTQIPGVPPQVVTPFTDCIIDNSSAREIGQFAKDAVIGVTETTASLVQSILERPETQTCIARAGLAALGS